MTGPTATVRRPDRCPYAGAWPRWQPSPRTIVHRGGWLTSPTAAPGSGQPPGKVQGDTEVDEPAAHAPLPPRRIEKRVRRKARPASGRQSAQDDYPWRSQHAAPVFPCQRPRRGPSSEPVCVRSLIRLFAKTGETRKRRAASGDHDLHRHTQQHCIASGLPIAVCFRTPIIRNRSIVSVLPTATLVL